MKTFVTGGSGFLGREMIQALVAAGHTVRALARSEKSAAAVRKQGAEPVTGDLDSVEAMQAGMSEVDWVFHCAAHTEEWDTDEAFFKVNVTGTENVMAAARGANIKRLVFVSTEAGLADGNAIIRADENTPFPAHPLAGYPATKGEAERRVRAANGNGGLETVVVRPRLIWGRGDTAMMSKLCAAVDTGRYMWMNGGKYLTSTCHVANACEGALLAAEKGRPGEVYFILDGEPVEFRWFITEVMKTQGRTPSDKSLPLGLVKLTAALTEGLWRTFKLKGGPPVTKVAAGLIGQEVTLSDAKARKELGYTSRVSMQAGLAELASQPPVLPVPR